MDSTAMEPTARNSDCQFCSVRDQKSALVTYAGQLIGSGDLSEGMQKRIERSLAGEKLPGYYPLGQAPVPIW